MFRAHLVKGYTVNERRLKELQEAVRLVPDVADRCELSGDEATAVLRVVADYAYALDVLDDYDQQRAQLREVSPGSSGRRKRAAGFRGDPTNGPRRLSGPAGRPGLHGAPRLPHGEAGRLYLAWGQLSSKRAAASGRADCARHEATFRRLWGCRAALRWLHLARPGPQHADRVRARYVSTWKTCSCSTSSAAATRRTGPSCARPTPCYDDRRLRERLAAPETNLLMIEHSGRTYRLSRRAAAILNQATTYDRTRRLDREAIKVCILTLLKDRPLRNANIRALTDLDRQQVTALLQELATDGQVHVVGHGAGARWRLGSGN